MFKKYRKIAAFLILFLGFSNAYAKPVLDIHQWTTQNGAQVFFVPTQQIPMLDIRLVFAAGSSRDAESFGLSSLTNSLIGEGSEHLSANQIAENFDAVGAAFSVQAGRDQASISLRTLTQENFLKPAISTFIEAVAHSNFSPDSIVRAKNAAFSAIKSQQQDPGALASNLFYAATFKDSPYAHAAVGTDKTISEITRQNMLDFYHQFYAAHNMKIILVGDISEAKAKQLSNEIAQAFPTGEKAPNLSAIPDTKKSDFVKVQFPAGQTSLMLGQVGISRLDPDFFSLVVGNMILGGSSQISLLNDVLRNQHGLVYFAVSEFMPMQYRGPFVINLKTKNQQAPYALSLIQKLLREFLKQGPKESQLMQAKQNIIGRFPLQMSTNANIVDILSAIAFYDLPLNYLDTYRSKINAVSCAEVKSAFEKHIKPDNLVVVSVGGETAAPTK